MSKVPPRAWRFYVDDMLACAEKVQRYTAGLDQAAFVANEVVYDATLRNLEIMGEAAKHIPEPVRTAHSAVPWRMVVALRNQLIHGYLGLDDDTLWSIVFHDLPPLLAALRALRSTTEP